RAEIDGRKAVTHFVRAVASIGRIAQTELTRVVRAPALGAAIVENRASVRRPRGDVGRRSPSTEIDVWEVVAHFVRAVASIGRIAQTELSGTVHAPAFDRTVVEHRAGMKLSGR